MFKKQIIICSLLITNYCSHASERPKSPDQSLSYIMENYGDDEVITYLNRHHVDINVCDEYRQSPLFLAIFCRHVKTVDWLLKRGAKYQSTDLDALTFARQSKERNTIAYCDGLMMMQKKNSRLAELEAIIELLEKSEGCK